MIFKRRKYGSDVVIYTKENGNFCTIKASQFDDPWVKAGALMVVLNHGQK